MNGQRKKAGAIGLLAAGAVAGGILASTLSATAASTPAPSATSPGPGAGGHRPDGAPPMRGDEKPVTGTALTTLRSEALKAVPGATIIRVETDSGGAAYEAHLKKADGSLVTVTFDQNLKVIRVEKGMCHGGHGGPPPPSSSGTTTG